MDKQPDEVDVNNTKCVPGFHSSSKIKNYRNLKGYKDEIADNLYGFGSFYPLSIQRRFNTGLWFLILVVSVNMIAGAVTNGILKVSAFSTLTLITLYK